MYLVITMHVVFITGANTGIGFETVKALLKSSKPYHIFLGSRTPSKGEQAIAELGEIPGNCKVELVQIDVQDDESIHKAVDVVKSKCDRVDTLINNAGMYADGAHG